MGRTAHVKRGLVVTAAAAALLWLVDGCIVSDQLETVTIEPDGSAEWVRFQSNIHSTEKGEKGAAELKRFAEDFEARRDPECLRIREAGGEIVEARWVRRLEPYATLVTARLPSSRALEAFCTLKNDKGETVIRGGFTREGDRRRLALAVNAPKQEEPAGSVKPTEAQRREEQANGISETRVAVAGGEIVASRGFILSSDRHSALLDSSGIQDLLRAGGGKLEIFLEWQVTSR